MIVSSTEISPGLFGFRTYQMAAFKSPSKRHRGFPSLAKDVAGLKLSQDRPGHLASDITRPDASALPDNREIDTELCGTDAQPDYATSNGDKFCTLQRLCQHAGADWGAAQMGIRNGSLKPDATAAGTHLWKPGPSARKAVATLSRMSK